MERRPTPLPELANINRPPPLFFIRKMIESEMFSILSTKKGKSSPRAKAIGRRFLPTCPWSSGALDGTVSRGPAPEESFGG
jgi:hypothetical protein